MSNKMMLLPAFSRLRINVKLFNAKQMLAPSFMRCFLRHQSTAVAAANKTRTWQLHSAVCLQRFPVISQDLTPIEQKYKTYLQTVEENNSLKSDHELQMIADIKREQQLKENKENDNMKTEANVSTAVEMEDEWQKQFDKFKPADRVTDADRNNDMTSVNRELDKHLVLIVKYKWSAKSEPRWTFPQVRWQEGESMRETAERALQTRCSDSVDATFMGNSPCGYSKYKLPIEEEEYGVKVFFFKAAYNAGSVVDMDNVIEHKWVTYQQLEEYLDSGDMDDVHDFLMDI